MLKRAFDIAVSAVALAVLAAPMIAIAVAIRLESRGRAIFRQRRAGWKGRSFVMLKFRTMRTDADPYGHSPHSGEDPRLTKVGRFLREKSLDELPQLWNVLVGEMSLVGPRPLYERQADEWNSEQRRRLDVRPGITGYAQACARASIPIEDKIEMDLHYVDHRSFAWDLRIIGRTVLNALRGAGEVYEKQYSRQSQYEKTREDLADGS
ncbi:MAG: sugar transferase [Phycisphaerae bacterium]